RGRAAGAGVGRHRGDAAEYVKATNELAEDGVVEIEEALWADGHEELRAVGVLARVGHRQLAVAAEDRLGVELVVELEAGPAGTVTAGVAALDDEVRHDAMERQAVVKLTLHEATDRLHRPWRQVAEELEGQVAKAGDRQAQEGPLRRTGLNGDGRVAAGDRVRDRVAFRA